LVFCLILQVEGNKISAATREAGKPLGNPGRFQHTKDRFEAAILKKSQSTTDAISMLE